MLESELEIPKNELKAEEIDKKPYSVVCGRGHAYSPRNYDFCPMCSGAVKS